MRRMLLLAVLAVFGVFVYYAAFRGIRIWALLPVLAALVAIWYTVSFVVTRKMVEKARGDVSFLFIRCSLITPDGNELVPGALAVTETELVFYARKNSSGGVIPRWSCFVTEIEGYSIEKVDDHHKGLSLSLTGGTSAVKFASSSFTKKESLFRNAIGWD